MSNIANTVLFLKGNPNRFLNISNQDTGKIIGDKKDVFLEDIENEDLESYIKKNLGTITKPNLVWVEMRTKYGTSSKKDNSCKIEVLPTNHNSETPNVTTPLIYAPVQATPIHHQVPSFQGSQPNMFGLGIADVIGMQVKADRLNHKEEQLADLKEDYKELKQKHNLLEIDHRDTLTKLSVAEAQKEMAVTLAKIENKSIFDSPAFASLMEKAPELIGSFAAMKSGGASIVPGALGSADVSETHRQFLEYVADNFNENQVNFLGSICNHINNESFINQVKLLIQQYNGSM
jgi:hypothetical protein